MVDQGGTAPRLAGVLSCIALVLSVIACTATSPAATSSAAPESPRPSPSNAAIESVPAPSIPPPNPIEGFATVVADRVNMRVRPSLLAERGTVYAAECDVPECLQAQVGQATRFSELYLLDGPVEAEGYTWFLAATMSGNALVTEFIGWVAAGDASGAWLVPHEPECPQPPIELGDLTYISLSRFAAIACFGRQELTVRGWYVDLPAGAVPNGGCIAQPAWLVCSSGYHMLRPEESGYDGDANNLQLRADPASVTMSSRGHFVLVTGMFDHPAAQACGNDSPQGLEPRLACRMEFVVTSARLAD